jgi:TnpA family transposase
LSSHKIVLMLTTTRKPCCCDVAATQAMVQVGKLLRTVFLCDYFVNEAFRRELLRVLNRGEAVNALKRAIYLGRVASYQAKQHEEMQAVADALSLLANLVMAWNTVKMRRCSTVGTPDVPPLCRPG